MPITRRGCSGGIYAPCPEEFKKTDNRRIIATELFFTTSQLFIFIYWISYELLHNSVTLKLTQGAKILVLTTDARDVNYLITTKRPLADVFFLLFVKTTWYVPGENLPRLIIRGTPMKASVSYAAIRAPRLLNIKTFTSPSTFSGRTAFNTDEAGFG
jgi:hypothetical protein